MRILHLVDGLGMGGKERQLLSLVHALENEHDVRCRVLTLKPSLHAPYFAGRDVSSECLERSRTLDMGVARRIYRIARDWRPHIIHTWDQMTSLFSIPGACGLRIPLLNGAIRDANPPAGKQQLLCRLNFRLADWVVANSDAGLRAYSPPKEKSSRIHNGFDDVGFVGTPDDIPRPEQLPWTRMVGMVANFADHKDQPTFIRAAIEMLSQRDDATFVMIGDGKHLERCRQMVPDELEDRILFLGPVDNVAAAVTHFDACVLATRPEMGEGIPNAAMEYMALGRPVVATNLGGIPELIEDGESGLLVAPGKPDDLAKSISAILDDTNLAARLGAQGKKALFDGFGVARMVDAYLTLYSQLDQRRPD